MNSYARRKRDIAFLEQRGKELEQLVVELVKQVRESGMQPRLLLGQSVNGNDFLTDVNQGEFMSHVLAFGRAYPDN